MKPYRPLVTLMLLYTAASLIHFTHNAQFVSDYPNLPVSLTEARIYGAWLVIAGVGLGGYLLLRLGQSFVGLCVVAVYAGLGFDGLLHYTLAPLSAHSWGMNLTIWFEVLAAALVFAKVLSLLPAAVRDARGA
jgi:hypothetical protein